MPPSDHLLTRTGACSVYVIVFRIARANVRLHSLQIDCATLIEWSASKKCYNTFLSYYLPPSHRQAPMLGGMQSLRVEHLRRVRIPTLNKG